MNTHTAPIDTFPLSIASGVAFCNRVEETEKLKSCIVHRRPVLLVSPRRYGKTSLVLHAIQASSLPYAHIDFFSAVDEYDIERLILKGVGTLISRMESLPKKALALATEIFEGSNIRAVLSNVELSIEINRRKEKPAYHVLDVLEKLEKLAEKTNRKIVLFFDEFQYMGEVTPNHAMESVLRQVAQLTKSISFIFSGSNRRLLQKIFDDRTRPFYKLCERITLDRISQQDYEKHIQQVARKKWKAQLEARTLECLFNYTECHPYYVNLLCSRLLYENEAPSPDSIDRVWRKYVYEERSNVAAEIELLSKNQKKLLIILARTGGTDAPLGQEFIQRANISKASLDQALAFLEKKDYVFKDEHGHTRVLDPLIHSVLGEA